MTTILSVRRDDEVAMGGDGQVSLGNTVMKGNARKVRRLYNDKVLAGFAGGTADAFTLFERFEAQLEKHQGRPAVYTAKVTGTFQDCLSRQVAEGVEIRRCPANLMNTKSEWHQPPIWRVQSEILRG